MKTPAFSLLLSVAATLFLFGIHMPAHAQSTSSATPKMYFSDTSRLGRPFAKDPSVIRFKGSYWLYYSLPATKTSGWGIGIAQSPDLIHWTKVSELEPMQQVEMAGVAAPGARVINGVVHLFYQTYGNMMREAICHATSTDAIHFDRDPSNPVYRPTQMSWSIGRAIDAEVYPYGNQMWLFFATRDRTMTIQEIGMASAPIDSGFARDKWHDVSIAAPILKPELPWEQKCIEAPTVLHHKSLYYLFYAGAYNNAPQQIGVATSKDGVSWKRMSDQPFLTNGAPGSWNSSESGHPGVFTDDNGRTYLFYQGNNDNGKTWYILVMEIRWHGVKPYLVQP